MVCRMTTGSGFEGLRIRRGVIVCPYRGMRLLRIALAVLATVLIAFVAFGSLAPSPASARTDMTPATFDGVTAVGLALTQTGDAPLNVALAHFTISSSSCDRLGQDFGHDKAHHCCHSHIMPGPTLPRANTGMLPHMIYLVSRNDGLTLYLAPLLRPPRT